jgi:hypothetical protein
MKDYEKIRESKRKWREKNKDKIREYQRLQREKKRLEKQQRETNYSKNAEIEYKPNNIDKQDKRKGDPNDPNRECSYCGVFGKNIKSGLPGKWTNTCHECRKKHIKSQSFNQCQTCGIEKESDYKRECNDCYKNRYLSPRVDIPGEDLLIIKKWVQKQIKFNFMTNLMGINELITNYLKISKSIYELDSMTSSKQLKRMWSTIWNFYNDELKDIPDDVLITMKSNRITKKIENKHKIINIMTNDDIIKIEKLIEHIDNIELDGKLYNLKEEFNLCTMGNKTACRRFRKMLVILNIDIKQLRITSLKYANK